MKAHENDWHHTSGARCFVLWDLQRPEYSWWVAQDTHNRAKP